MKKKGLLMMGLLLSQVVIGQTILGTGSNVDAVAASQRAAKMAADQAASTAAAAQRKASLMQQIKDGAVFKKIYDIQQKILEAKEKFDWVKKLETIKRINQILETSVCNTRQLELNLYMADKFDCISKLNYDFMLLDLNASIDFLWVIVASGLQMEPGARIQSLNDVLTLLEKSQKQIMEFNKSISFSVMEAKKRDYYKNMVRGGFSTGRY